MKKSATPNTKPNTKAAVTVNDLPIGTAKEKSVKGGAMRPSHALGNFTA